MVAARSPLFAVVFRPIARLFLSFTRVIFGHVVHVRFGDRFIEVRVAAARILVGDRHQSTMFGSW
ncbi:MAG: hypothetical protein ACO3NR_04730 [Rhodothermales bacterium]